MNDVLRARTKILRFALFIIPTIVVSYITLWILETPLKYIFAILEFFLIISLYICLKNIKITLRLNTAMDLLKNLDFIIICITFFLFLLSFLGVNNFLTFITAIFISFFGLGYILLRFLNFYSFKSDLEWLVLSFWLSIAINCIIYTLNLIFPFSKQALIIATQYFIFTFVFFIFQRKRKSIKCVEYQINIEVNNLLPLAIVIIFIITSIAVTYPNMAQLPGLDIIRHFSSSQLLNSNAKQFNSPYPWFNFQWASLQLFYVGSREVFQTTLAYLSIISILSFYILAKAYLSDIDRRMPVLSTVLWGLFSGFGWLYFLSLKLTAEGHIDYLKLLGMTGDVSYWDVGYGQGPWLWLWFRPITLGMTGLFILLHLLRRTDLNLRTLLPLISISTLTLGLVHLSELVFFLGLLLVLNILFSDGKLRLMDGSISSLVGLFSIVGFSILYFSIGIGVTISNIQLGAPIIVVALALLITRLKQNYSRLSLPTVNFDFIHYLMMGLTGIWFSTLIYWLSNSENFHVSLVSSVLGVPWLLYPALLGIPGLFAILGVSYIIKNYQYRSVVVFIIILIYASIFGRTLTYINVNYLNIGYWERRIIPITYGAASIIATIPLIDFYEVIQRKNTAFLGVFLSFLVILGITSTFLSIEYRVHLSEKYTLNDEDLESVNMLNTLNTNKVLLTSTSYSRSLAEFVPSSWLINYYRYPIWSAKYPALPLNILYSMDKPVYLFSREADVHEINQKYSLGYLATHFLPRFMSNNSPNNVSIILLPEMIAPLSNSQTLLVKPNQQNPSIWYAYDILSQASCNYSTVLIDDLITISKAKTLIAPTEDIALKLIQYKEFFNFTFDKLVILNLDGYRNIALNYFSSPKMTFSLDEKTKEIAELKLDAVSRDHNTVIATPTIFEISSKSDHGDFLGLLDDNVYDWQTSGIGFGNISLPELILNYENKVQGNASVRINVKAGKFGYWQLAKYLAEPINISNFDFISFDWYGRGDGKNYVLHFHSGPSNSYWYSFSDTWHGWKKVKIPMRIPDGRYNLNGISFVKVTNGKPTWSNILKVEIRNEGSNPNLSGTFLIDNFGFDSAPTINFNIISSASVNTFNLFNHDGTNWRSVTELTSNKTVLVPSFTFMNGMNSTTIFGERTLLNVTMNKELAFSTIRISIRLPPYLGDKDLSSVKMKIIPEIQKIKVDKIFGPNGSLFLRAECYFVPFTAYNNVIYQYSGDEGTVPFSISETLNNFEKIYVNIYPLITDINYNKSNYEVLAKLVDLLDANHIFPKAQVNAENPVTGRLATFNKVDLEGYIIVHSDSLIIRARDRPLTLKFNEIELSNISKIVFVEEKVTLKLKNASISSGEDFYSHLYSKKLIVNSNDNIIGRTLLEFDNGTAKVIVLSTHEVDILGDLNAVLRQPAIQVEGTIKFNELYTYAILSKTIGILGDDAVLRGKLSFNVIYGDIFTVVNNFTYVGQINTSHENYYYDELKGISQSFPIFIIICLFYLTIYILKKPNTISKKEPKKANG